jgi:hypothetical protein
MIFVTQYARQGRRGRWRRFYGSDLCGWRVRGARCGSLSRVLYHSVLADAQWNLLSPQAMDATLAHAARRCPLNSLGFFAAKLLDWRGVHPHRCTGREGRQQRTRISGASGAKDSSVLDGYDRRGPECDQNSGRGYNHHIRAAW